MLAGCMTAHHTAGQLQEDVGRKELTQEAAAHKLKETTPHSARTSRPTTRTAMLHKTGRNCLSYRTRELWNRAARNEIAHWAEQVGMCDSHGCTAVRQDEPLYSAVLRT